MSNINKIKKFLIDENIIDNSENITDVKGFNNLKDYKKLIKNTIKHFKLELPINFNILNSYLYRYDINNDIKNIKSKKLSKNEIENLLEKYNLPTQQEYINNRNKIIVSKRIKILKKKLLHK